MNYQKQRWLLAFKETNQTTQKVKYERFLNSIFARVGASHLRSSKSDTELSVYHISCFISFCPFVALSKATFAENLDIVLSRPY